MTASKGTRGGAGYSFNGAKAKRLAVRLSSLRKANELARWPEERVQELCEHLANGAELEAIAKIMGAPQGEAARAFRRVCSLHPQHC